MGQTRGSVPFSFPAVPKRTKIPSWVEHNGTLFEDAPQALKENQLAALPYLVAAPTVAEGARLAAIGRTTLYR